VEFVAEGTGSHACEGMGGTAGTPGEVKICLSGRQLVLIVGRSGSMMSLMWRPPSGIQGLDTRLPGLPAGPG